MKKTRFSFISILYYLFLVILISYLIWPYTRFYYKKEVFRSFSYRLNKESVTLKVNKRCRIYVTNINKRVSYSTTDFKVAGVNQLGIVYAKKKGTAVIRVKVEGEVLKCKVIVE